MYSVTCLFHDRMFWLKALHSLLEKSSNAGNSDVHDDWLGDRPFVIKVMVGKK